MVVLEGAQAAEVADHAADQARHRAHGVHEDGAVVPLGGGHGAGFGVAGEQVDAGHDGAHQAPGEAVTVGLHLSVAMIDVFYFLGGVDWVG